MKKHIGTSIRTNQLSTSRRTDSRATSSEPTIADSTPRSSRPMRYTSSTVSSAERRGRRTDDQLRRSADRGHQRPRNRRTAGCGRRTALGVLARRRPASGRPVSTMWRPTSRKMCSSKFSFGLTRRSEPGVRPRKRRPGGTSASRPASLADDRPRRRSARAQASASDALAEPSLPSGSAVVRPEARGAPRAAGRCRRRDGRGRPRRAAAPQTTHRPGQSGRQSGAIGSASWIASRTGVSRSSSWWSVRRATSGSSSVGERPAGREVERRQVLLLRAGARPGRSTSRRQRLHSSVERGRRGRRVARIPRFVRSRRTRPSIGSARRRSSPRSIVTPRDLVESRSAPGLVRRAGRRRSRPAAPSTRPARVTAVVRRRLPASSSQRLAVGLVVGRSPVGRERGAPLVEQRDPLLDALERLDDVALEADQHADRVLVGAAADLVGVAVGVGDDRAALASAAWVRPRSSMRNAACSWARATIRSASSWAFSMIRSPSALIRLAARTSSGTATRSSSMRPSAAFWSTTTLVVSGSFLPLAISDSRRSTRKMMSIGVPSRLAGRRPVAQAGRQVSHAGVARQRRPSAVARGAAAAAGRDHRRRRRRRSRRSP